MEGFAFEFLPGSLEEPVAEAAKVVSPPKNPLFENSALNWSTEVLELKNFSFGAPSVRQHLLWHTSAQNEIYEFLSIFEIVPLIRLSRTHKQFIEKEYCTRRLVLGSSLLWKILCSTCRWFRAWILRSLPGLETVTFGYGKGSTSISIETIEVLKAIMMCPPRNLRILIWLHWELQGFFLPARRINAIFPSLQTLIWNAPGVFAAHMECPNLKTAILSRSWSSMSLLAETKFQRVLMDDIPQNKASKLCTTFDIDFYIPQGKTIATGTSLLQVVDNLRLRARGHTINGRLIELYAAVSPLASSDWGLLGNLGLELGLPEQHRCRSDSCVEWDHSSEWTAARIDSVWDKLMALWHLHQVTVPNDLKHALFHSSVGTRVLNNAPGMLQLIETCSLKSMCSGICWLPLLRVEPEPLEGRLPGIVEVNQRGMDGPLPERDDQVQEAYRKWIEQIEYPVTHVHFGPILDRDLIVSVMRLLRRNRETIEYVCAEVVKPLEGVDLPNLKTLCCKFKGRAPWAMVRDAKHLRHIEMPTRAWLKIYFDFQRELEVGSVKVRLAAQSPNGSTYKRFGWPSDCRRIMHCTVGEEDYNDYIKFRKWKYRIIARMQIQFLVLHPAMQTIDQVYGSYELVYTLRKKYNHKLQVISCAVGLWEYPWDYAISEMTRGEVTERTWIDLRIAVRPDVIRRSFPEDAKMTGGPGHWTASEGKYKAPLSEQPKMCLGARNRPVYILKEALFDRRIEEIDNLSPSQRRRLERWYSQLRSAIPSDLYTLCSPSFEVGMVSPTDEWFINALKNRRFDEINKWIRIESLPTLDFTKFDACTCPLKFTAARPRLGYCFFERIPQAGTA